jgi:predicted alpha-1,2-mannosidase
MEIIKNNEVQFIVNMKSISTFFLCLVANICLSQSSNFEYINPMMGTSNSFLLSNGNTLPLFGQPFGFTYWTAQTQSEGMFKYNYPDTTFYGIRATHSPSPWMGDFAAFNFLPSTRAIEPKSKKRFLSYSHLQEKASPAYYANKFDQEKIQLQSTATDRCGFIKIDYPQSAEAKLYINLQDGESYYKFNASKNILFGYVKNNSGGVPDNFAGYFYIKLNNNQYKITTIQNDTIIGNLKEYKGKKLTLCFTFKTNGAIPLEIRVGTSFIDMQQAALNLEKEIGKTDFKTVMNSTINTWEKYLNKIEVSGGTEEQRRVFYSCMYRSLLFPTKFYEYGNQNQKLYYSPYDGKIHQGVMYTNNGIWDTFRAALPLLTIIAPKVHQEFCQSLVNAYQEGGWLPRWLSPGYREIMIGVHAASVFADAVSKGLSDFDVEKAYEGVWKDATVANPISDRNKEGLEHYNEKGFVLSTVREGVAKNLEYAYDDYCGYILAKNLKKYTDTNTFLQRAFNYKNTFEGSYGLMRGKDKRFRWRTPFNPFAWGGDFTEGNSWHYSWSVFQDPQGLINLMGGRSKMIAKMDSVFTLPQLYNFDYYGWKIHEITELENAKMGQYSHGNQPMQHFIYLYNYAGAPYKCQYWNRYILNNLYNSTEKGYCGDEDNGQTSAWYVMSAMGFYSVCPGSAEYVLSSPLFDKVKIKNDIGTEFVIEAFNNAADRPYIQLAYKDKIAFNNTYFTHSDLLKGGTLQLEMGAKPNSLWASKKSSAPFSLSKQSKCSPPYIQGKTGVIADSTLISLHSLTDSTTIYFTLDNSEPNHLSKKYHQPFYVKNTCTLKAVATRNGFLTSDETQAFFDNTFINSTLVTASQKGIKYAYFEGDWETLPNFDLITPIKRGVLNQISLEPKERKNNFAILYEGMIEIENDDLYTFYFKTDDGCRFYIGDKLIHEALGRHGMEEYNESVKLRKGFHKIRIEYNEIDGGEGILIKYESKSTLKTELPLFYTE